MNDVLDWLSKYKSLAVYYYFDENGEGWWYVGKQCAGTSDLKFDLISAGDTPKEALEKARKFLNKKVDK